MAELLLYNIYNDATGRIVKYFWIPDGDSTTIPLNTGAGETAVQDGNDPLLYYYPAGVATLRPEFTDDSSWDQTTIDCDGVDDAIFGASLPNPTEVVINSPSKEVTEQTVTTGTFTFTTLVPGDHVIKFTAFPYLDYEVIITAEIIATIASVASWDVTTIDADGVDAATLGAGLPNPTTISIVIITAEGSEEIDDFTVADGSLVLKSNVIGVYSVTAISPGYTSLTQTITVVAP